MTDCLICRLPLKHEPDYGNFGCERCGRFGLITEGATGSFADLLKDRPGNSPRRRANLSHMVRRRGRDGEEAVGIPVKAELLEKWGLDDPLPNPVEVLDGLILWVGDRAPGHSEGVLVSSKPSLAGWLGLALPASPNKPDRPVDWLLNSPKVMGLVEIVDRSGPLALRLTWEGWERYDDLKRRETTSFTAFMAMKFRKQELDAVVDDHFKPAVAATGFTLKRVTDGQAAGEIDDQMRVGLRNCRFVIADLTYGSAGAYWEAGFGEGLGKPVIYTCRLAEWEKEGTHFDTNHLATIVWDPDDLDRAVRELKAMIRATLPDVAKMTD